MTYSARQCCLGLPLLSRHLTNASLLHDVLDAPVLLGLAAILLGVHRFVALLVCETLARAHPVDDAIAGEDPLLVGLASVGHRAEVIATPSLKSEVVEG